MATLMLALPTAASAQTEITLAECVRASVTANHPILAREAETAAARERANGSRAARMPNLFFQTDLLQTGDPMRLSPATANNQPGVFTRDTWQASLGVSVPLYTGGRLSAQENAARLLAEATDADLGYARQALAARVVAIYQDVLALRTTIRSLDQSRETLAAQSERTRALIDQEKAAEVDFLRLSVRLASIDQFAIEARNRIAIAKATIFVLMGREPSADWSPADTLKMPPASREIEVASLSALRADEIAAQARAAAAAEQIAVARAGYRPNIDAVAGYGTRGDFHSRAHEESAFVGIQMTWNIWDFDRTRSRVAEAEANQQVFAEAATETALQRRLERSNAEASLRAAAAKIEASRLAVEQSRESLRIEQRKYELGQGTVTDVLDAQSAAVEAESLRARALADHTTALAARDLALGTIFTSSASVPALRTSTP